MGSGDNHGVGRRHQVVTGAAQLDLAVQPGGGEGGLAALGTRQHADEAGGAVPGPPLSRVEVVAKGTLLILFIEAV